MKKKIDAYLNEAPMDIEQEYINRTLPSVPPELSKKIKKIEKFFNGKVSKVYTKDANMVVDIETKDTDFRIGLSDIQQIARASYVSWFGFSKNNGILSVGLRENTAKYTFITTKK